MSHMLYDYSSLKGRNEEQTDTDILKFFFFINNEYCIAC